MGPGCRVPVRFSSGLNLSYGSHFVLHIRLDLWVSGGQTGL